jgi:hypothetical protein
MRTDNKDHTEIVNTPSQPLDGFEGHTTEVEGEDERQSGSIIKGTLIKFTNDFAWVTHPDLSELPAGLELVPVKVERIVQKWVDQTPVETRILAPGERFPNLKAMNEAAPKHEWSEGPDGQMRGPYQMQHVLYLVHLQTMERYTYPTSTIGGTRAITDLVDQINWMRRYRGQHVYPIVTLADVHMKTRFGGRQRPAFTIKAWTALGPDEKALPPLQPRTIEGPGLAEQMGDEISFK